MLRQKIVIFLSFFFVFFASFAAHASSESTPNLISPYLKIKQFNGQIFDLEANKGKLTLIMFWANWCSNCKRDMPVLDEIYKKYQERGFSIIAISTDYPRQKAKSEAIASKFSFPSAIASEVIKSSFALPNRIPTYFLISKNGRFLGEIFMEENFEKRAFEKILEQNLN